ncbi:hypothetical protein [Phaeobacter sp. J2-8]|uniref:hypothetical protein n=1 Tax=Phaeobacter sp. J2-8 TaxID=2931394 RepID=UPI001FD0339F|nr:hypothetical protein [Phaeobacter sp. J2-8]MCJ7872516.1 hypothetical protein [Phaeobacter sp. J2-8]
MKTIVCSCMMAAVSALTMALPLTLAPAMADAQPKSVIISLCQAGLGAGTETELAEFLAGPWQMTAPGTGFTTGTNQMVVDLAVDPATGGLRMGGGGMSVPLVPLNAALEAGNMDWPEPPIDMSVAALTPGGLTQQDVEVLTGCADPLRYWWQFGKGDRRSWGALMFFGNDDAVGYMANSAGGTRQVQLHRAAAN